MKKRLFALLTVLVLLFSAVAVHAAGYTPEQLRIADAFHHVGLFLGTESGYELNRHLTRTEGMVLLVRMLGQEEAVKTGTYECPFTDVDAWAVNYIGYAYENGITRGYSDTVFGAEDPMTDYMFLTLTLRALGYDDRAADAAYSWDDPYALAHSLGLIREEKADADFTRADSVTVFWHAFTLDSYKMAHALIERGVFTEEALKECIEIYMYGRILPRQDSEEETTAYTPPVIPPVPQETEREEVTTVLPEVPKGAITYEEYEAMSGAEQEAYFAQFSDPMDFFVWLDEAKAAYDAKHPSIDIGDDGNIDLGDLGN